MNRSGMLLWAALCVGASVNAAPVELKVDLKPLIRAAATSKVQFAVPVAHTASAAQDGQWTVSGGRAVWHYAVRVPTATSLSFHAGKVSLPADAWLTVQSAQNTVTYQAADIRRSELWSRVQPGDALQLELSVPAAARAQVVFELQSLQAGYRALGPQAQDHPYYRQLIRAATTGTASCAQNYQCNVTTANTPPAQATVGIVVQNLYQCSGTLINDVPGDNTPYVLTARHCETGALGGGYPGAASSLTVYWDATSPCSASLGSLYDPGIVTQTGATTVVEQEDAWLVKLDQNPVVKDAQFAGFDASGTTVQGGYTIHHALGFDKQITDWYGAAYSAQQSGALGVSYVSHFLETVNSAGNIGPGASGSALMSAGDRLVGVLSLGIKSNDQSGYEACPATTPAAPNGTNAAAYFTSLGAVWNATADTSSTTGNVTLKSVLDPANSGTTAVASTPALNINFTASSYNPQQGSTLTLSWDAPGATACLPSDGVSGDGWTGTRAATGQAAINENVGSAIRYSLTCQFSGNQKVFSTLTVYWLGTSPYLFLDSGPIRWTGADATLTWSSNLTPCSLSGGALALTNQPSAGSTTTTQSAAGDVTYSLTCGGATLNRTTTYKITYVTPDVTFRANGTDRLLGEEFDLVWSSYADRCIPSGGVANDGWSGNALGAQNTFMPRVGVAGTATYTLTCLSGPNSVSKSVTVTFENNAPYVTASATATSVVYSNSPADYFSVSWKSNLTYCAVTTLPYLANLPYTYPLTSDAEDTFTFAPTQPGTVTVTVACTPAIGSANASASATPLVVTVMPPPAPTVTIAADQTTVAIGQTFKLTWTSTNASGCTATGTGQAEGIAWAGGTSTNASQHFTPTHAGTATLGITCASIDTNQGPVSASTTVTVFDPQPTVSLTADQNQVANGAAFTLTWTSSSASSCTASGGGADGTSWTGSLATSGSLNATGTTAGTFTYTITCTGMTGETAQAQQTITVAAAPVTPPPASTSSSKGGGGAVGLVDVFTLAALYALSTGRRVRRSRLPHARRNAHAA